MKILLVLLGLLLLLILVVLVRTIAIKPTAPFEFTLPQVDEKVALEYGEKLSQMIRCETVSERNQTDRSKFYAYQEKLRELFPKVWEVCEYHDFNGSLLLKWPGKGKAEPILFMSHQDVVAAGEDWEREPFGGEIADGAVWGRGTVDTKGSFFCFMQAAEELMAQGFVPEGDIYLAGSCTEEVSGEGGPLTAAWLKKQGVHLRYLIDEGGMVIEEPVAGAKGLYAMVGVLEKGYGDVKFIAKGKGGHASAPGKKTPWTRLAAFINHVEKHPPFTAKINDTTQEMFTRMAPNMGFAMKMLFCNFWLFKGLLTKLMPAISPVAGALMQTTLAFTRGAGSKGYNVLPEEAYVTGNMRFIHHEPAKESIEKISKIAAKFDVETEVITSGDPCPVVSYKTGEFKLIEDTIKKIYPMAVVSPYAMTGGTDARFYKDVCDNCIRFAPLYINGQQYKSIHAKNENINLSTLPLGVEFYRQLMMNKE